MSARVVIDSVEFARAGQRLSGVAPVGELARLADSLFDAGGELRRTAGPGFFAELAR